MIKVVLTGSESTGKTELARELARHFDAPLSEEFVREYAAARGGKLSFADHGPIAQGQMAAEDAAIARARDLVILDTDLVSTAVYCEHYFGSCPPWILEKARARAGDLYLLMKPDVPWVADGVRDRSSPGERETMHALFRKQLESLSLTFVEIGGSRAHRFQTAVAAITERANRAEN